MLHNSREFQRRGARSVGLPPRTVQINNYKNEITHEWSPLHKVKIITLASSTEIPQTLNISLIASILFFISLSPAAVPPPITRPTFITSLSSPRHPTWPNNLQRLFHPCASLTISSHHISFVHLHSSILSSNSNENHPSLLLLHSTYLDLGKLRFLHTRILEQGQVPHFAIFLSLSTPILPIQQNFQCTSPSLLLDSTFSLISPTTIFSDHHSQTPKLMNNL